jgi:hypothetical protein
MPGIPSTPSAGARVVDVSFSGASIRVDLADGRAILAPLAWYPRLLEASPAERANWEVAGGGFGIHWPSIDEDLSVEGLLRGAPAPGALV